MSFIKTIFMQQNIMRQFHNAALMHCMRSSCVRKGRKYGSGLVYRGSALRKSPLAHSVFTLYRPDGHLSHLLLWRMELERI
jgi:hypothetical protein